MLVAANKYGLDRLKRLCEKYLVSLIELENVIELLYLSDMHQAVELKRMCINYTMMYFDIVTKREDFKKLSKNILLELLQNKWRTNASFGRQPTYNLETQYLQIKHWEWYYFVIQAKVLTSGCFSQIIYLLRNIDKFTIFYFNKILQNKWRNNYCF